MQIGQEVTVRVQNKLARTMVSYSPKILEISGKVVPSPEFLGPDYICLSSSRNPCHMINRELIVSIDGVANNVIVKEDTEVFIITGSKGDQYTVTRNSNIWSCTCKGFQFHRDCKHIREAKVK